MRISDCSSDVCSSYLNPVGSNGVFVASAPLVAGQHVRKAEAPIIEALQASGALVHLATIMHSYPQCWRHKTPLTFCATQQRSEARRVGKECVRTCRSRWSPYH